MSVKKQIRTGVNNGKYSNPGGGGALADLFFWWGGEKCSENRGKCERKRKNEEG
jgi:hypothetical protein